MAQAETETPRQNRALADPRLGQQQPAALRQPLDRIDPPAQHHRMARQGEHRRGAPGRELRRGETEGGDKNQAGDDAQERMPQEKTKPHRAERHPGGPEPARRLAREREIDHVAGAEKHRQPEREAAALGFDQGIKRKRDAGRELPEFATDLRPPNPLHPKTPAIAGKARGNLHQAARER